jgi:D-alanine transaminase
MEPIKVLTNDLDVVNMYASADSSMLGGYKAFYNGRFNTIIVNPKWALVSFFDKIVIRGYAVFDTVNMINGKLFALKEHIERFYRSINYAKIPLTYTPEQVENILINLARVAKFSKGQGHLRYFMSRGGSELIPISNPATKAVFYAVAFEMPVTVVAPQAPAFTSSIPLKPKLLAITKTSNYLLNCMAADESSKKGGQAIFETDDGYPTESSIAGVGFIIDGDTYHVPPYEQALDSVTALVIFDLIKKHMLGKEITKISRENIKSSELKKRASEMLIVGADKVIPVLSWDGVKISEGVGPITKKIIELYKEATINSHYCVSIDKPNL